ncbi:transmembrane protein 218 isoform 1-T2 [Clarias gariepinus]|uniref:transmembrane protein 218 n=1 Tax=Clarias gariepinus TaxID=13013 RepID=UPI00234D4116|nr:transmembrane protein 218 [Clarias gariepinus]XP_053331850.1 transmembrane protein 218 [Clarias gariepinus]
MGGVLGVGTGVFLIILIWIGTLVLSLIMSRAAGPAKHGIIPLVLLALTITLILVLFPRASELPSSVQETQIVDTFFIGRYVLLAVVIVVFLVSLFFLLPFHLLEPVYAKPLRTH